MVPTELGRIKAKMAAFAAEFEPAVVSGTVAERLVAEAAAIENMAATVKGLAARRAADCSRYKTRGARGPAEDLARQTGIGVGAAREQLETAERMESQPELADAARKGELSSQQTAAISDAAAADPSAEHKLVEKAKTSTLTELREDCARTKAAADPDPDATHRRIHANRSCRKRRTADGGGEIVYHSTLDEIAEAWAVISGFANAAFRHARRQGRREPHDAYAADGFLAMARAAAAWAAGQPAPHTNPPDDDTDGAPGEPAEPGADDTTTAPAPAPATPAPTPPPPVKPAQAIIRIDWDALVRGWPIDGEVCEIAGIGPVPATIAQALLASGDVFLSAVVTKGVDVVNVAHLGRYPTAHQNTALLWQYPTCAVEGCDRVAGLQRDHRHDWANTKITLLAWLDRICEHHHDLKTRHGWALIAGTGKRPFVPPDDPRHPTHTHHAHQPRDGPVLAG